MAFTTQQGRTATSLSEINVTPLVDVMLVLLIIFMVTAPMMQTGIDVQLPETRNVREANPDAQIILSISNRGELYFNSDVINYADLPERLKREAKSPQDAIFVRADREVKYDIIVSVFDAVRGAGFSEIKLVTRPFTPPSAKSKR
ncbi:MAG: biopolymer transporter ExbD [Acidobacteria bacterium]|nr:biopolymer transporter ExbD [Acidobacteriota bacterium]